MVIAKLYNELKRSGFCFC